MKNHKINFFLQNKEKKITKKRAHTFSQLLKK